MPNWAARRVQLVAHDSEKCTKLLIQGLVKLLEARAREGLGPLPISALQEEYWKRWRVYFNPEAVGYRDAIHFVSLFPDRVDLGSQDGVAVITLAGPQEYAVHVRTVFSVRS